MIYHPIDAEQAIRKKWPPRGTVNGVSKPNIGACTNSKHFHSTIYFTNTPSNLLKHTHPEGIYLSLTPDNFNLWSGVLFLHTGPYAPAILRFQVVLPQTYPSTPPQIRFTSDIFHPLITPLTTYTYSTATPASKTVSSGDDERLLPGSLSLRHGFPSWFGQSASAEPMFRDITNASESSGEKAVARRPLSFHIPPPKEDAIDHADLQPSMVEVLLYMKRVFEDETLLDDLPLDAAANTGAWHAWRAHRRKTNKTASKAGDGKAGVAGTSTPSHARGKSEYEMAGRRGSAAPAEQIPQASAQKKSMADWNWDGVWLERVKRGIASSVSDAVLYGGEGDDLIRFLDVEDDEYAGFKEVWSAVDEME